ncbi:MAG TPA: hypothetical protein VKV39_08685 [Candidatus Sulfotelmatobacter sp.]|nr:hypothetical protein [Candidatus Sulfotelmatobacter sp.]
MRTGLKFVRVAGIIILFCLGSLAASSQSNHKAHKSKKPPLQPLPSGPTGPIQQIPLDSMAPVPPHVTYDQGQLTIVAANSTLADILRAVRKQTGAEIEVPDAKERVVTHLGPGPAQEIIAELLNGSRYNYVLLGSPQDPGILTRVVLVARTSADKPGTGPAGQPAPGLAQATGAPQQPQADSADASDAEVAAPEDNADENAEQVASEPEQPAPQPDAPAVKTPQELLQEMQQRQIQLQQQQQAGQPPAPAPGVPVQPRPQENQ